MSRPAGVPLDPDFDAACEAEGIPAADRAALDALLRAWRKPAQSEGERRHELFGDYRHWQLYVRSRAGDADAARAFERHWRRQVGGFLRGRASADEIDEIAALFFVRVYRLIGGERAWDCPFVAYLRTLLINLCRDEGRRLGLRRKREVALEAPGDAVVLDLRSKAPSAERLLLEGERLGALERALERLPPTDLFLLRQVALEERPGPEVAAELGLALPALWKRVQRAKGRLKELLAEEGIGQGSMAGRSKVAKAGDAGRPRGVRQGGTRRAG